MLRPDARVIKPRRNRMTLKDLSIFVLQQIGAVAMQHTWTPPCQACAMLHLVIDAFATCLNANDLHILVIQEGVKQPHRI